MRNEKRQRKLSAPVSGTGGAQVMLKNCDANRVAPKTYLSKHSCHSDREMGKRRNKGMWLGADCIGMPKSNRSRVRLLQILSLNSPRPVSFVTLASCRANIGGILAISFRANNSFQQKTVCGPETSHLKSKPSKDARGRHGQKEIVEEAV